MVTNPGCSFESGLGVFALNDMKVFPTLRLVRQLVAKGPKGDPKQLIRDDDAACVTVTATGAPIASQFDGDYLGLRESMTFRAVRDMLPVVAPPCKNPV
jgi:diacylglycerol kinase family enzyme